MKKWLFALAARLAGRPGLVKAIVGLLVAVGLLTVLQGEAVQRLAEPLLRLLN